MNLSPNTPPLTTTVRNYFISKKKGNEKEYVLTLIQKIKENFKSTKNNLKSESVRELIFINLRGFDTKWADLDVLDLMASNDFSSKRVAYTAATQMWNSESPVVLMATNTIQRDLNSANNFIVSIALSSFSPYLSISLSQSLSQDIVSLMSSSNIIIKQK